VQKLLQFCCDGRLLPNGCRQTLGNHKPSQDKVSCYVLSNAGHSAVKASRQPAEPAGEATGLEHDARRGVHGEIASNGKVPIQQVVTGDEDGGPVR
jgi:hypothetical protein